MGNPSDYLKEKSPYIRLQIGEKTGPMKYKAWKGMTNTYGEAVCRYAFEIETEEGFVIKTFDNGSQAFSDQMSKIPFNALVVISRHPKLDKNGNPIADKSIYKVKLADLSAQPEPDGGGGGEKGLPDSEHSEGDKPAWAEKILNEE